jgi:hypothetical protein
VAVRYALGAPLRPLVVTNIYNDLVVISDWKSVLHHNFSSKIKKSHCIVFPVAAAVAIVFLYRIFF